MKNKGSITAAEIDMEYRMKKVYIHVQNAYFTIKKIKDAKKENVKTESGTKHYKVGEGVKNEIL